MESKIRKIIEQNSTKTISNRITPTVLEGYYNILFHCLLMTTGLIFFSITTSSCCFLFLVSTISPENTIDMVGAHEYKTKVLCAFWTLFAFIPAYLLVERHMFHKRNLGYYWELLVKTLTFMFLSITFFWIYYGLNTLVFAGYNFAKQFGLHPKGIIVGFALWCFMPYYMSIALNMIAKKMGASELYNTLEHTIVEGLSGVIFLVLIALSILIHIIAFLVVIRNCTNFIMADPQSMEVFTRSSMLS
ncbi:hypothetical protein NEFER03_1970 [Nematocida sp. LUAm3]|nr:hypothetical protein NEFER03_1970 [Nematocida sp. LUAm3]KAI5176054.1 hypothetical protein NEFER02_1888 [Nematocida sp. LUAm2]KAI5177098.1 hypothetical protein NEFER01_0373 [Nematocida sp. LUAm1]